MAKIKKIKPARIFDTLADVGSLFMAVVYILYVALLLIFDYGTTWLNWTMLGITIVYILFFVIKLSAINGIFEKRGVQRRAKFIIRYSKWSMKLINAAFVCTAIATTRNSEGNVLMMVGIFIVGFSFLISVLWDVAWFVVRRKMNDLKLNWDNLSQVDKSKRIEMIVDTFIHSLDSITGVDVTQSVQLTAAVRQNRKSDQEDKPTGQTPSGQFDTEANP